jgi:hypothetical protein
MKIAINFADENFEKVRRLNSQTAKLVGGFDEVLEYSTKDIDTHFFDTHKSILSEKRGGGYWLWKPYFINLTLEKLNIGDYIFYCDSGAFYINNIDHLIRVMESKKQDVMLFESPLIEVQWTNKFLLNSLNANNEEIKYSNQIVGGYILIKKSERSVAFIKEYLELCTNQDYLTDIRTVKEEIAIGHRHDQSILSTLAKLNNIIPYKDPSDYGKFPFRYFAKNRLFRLNHYDTQYPVIVLSNRKENPYIYFLKYMMRSFINKGN